MKALAIGVGVILVVVFAGFFEPQWLQRWIPSTTPSPPPVDTFRIAAIQASNEPGALFENPGGRVCNIVLDYQGPKELIELIIENWDGKELISTSTVLKQPYGCKELVKRGNTVFGETHAAFSHTRERYSIWLEELPEEFPDGRNALAHVVYGDPSIPNSVWHAKELVDVIAFGESRGNGSTTQFDWILSSDEPKEMRDTAEIVLWHKSSFPSGAVDTDDPPYGDGVCASRLILRFVKE